MKDQTPKPRFLLVTMTSHQEHPELASQRINETQDLISTYGGITVNSLSQNLSHSSQATYIGKGKVQEIAALIESQQIDVVVINDSLSSSQQYALKLVLNELNPEVKVWDRTDLILHIFKAHAHTAEAKLQIKLAEIRHKGPELQGIGKNLSQQGAGIGTRGQGETQTEISKRHWRQQIKHLEAELITLTKGRERQMLHRKRLRLPTISLVGYTNAGKSTLFNRLTKKQNLVKDELFATLDSSVGKLYLHGLLKEAFVTDTIGFIQNVPPDLIQAFQSTLMETVNADLLLHVIDASDSFFREKIEAVETVLQDLHLQDKHKLYVFNKIDLVPEETSFVTEQSQAYRTYQPQFISAASGQSLDDLILSIEAKVK
jgi:GTPase